MLLVGTNIGHSDALNKNINRNDMKITHLIFAAVSALVLVSCNDSVEVRNIKGSYHYKTTGQVTLTDSSKTQIHTLDNESGIMEVVSLHDDDEVLLTFNQTGGEVYNTKGTAHGDKVTFDPFHRLLTVTYAEDKTVGILDTLSITKHETETFAIQVSGRAEVYDNNIIFYYTYDGKSQTSSKTIHGTDIQMLAKKN